MTTRELRAALFMLHDQQMTVEQLRAMLFLAEDQDAEIEIGFGTFLKMESEYAEQTKRENL